MVFVNGAELASYERFHAGDVILSAFHIHL